MFREYGFEYVVYLYFFTRWWITTGCGELCMSYGKEEGLVVGRTIITMKRFMAFVMDKFIVITWLMDFGLLAKER
jgi:hypothetical protein